MIKRAYSEWIPTASYDSTGLEMELTYKDKEANYSELWMQVVPKEA